MEAHELKESKGEKDKGRKSGGDDLAAFEQKPFDIRLLGSTIVFIRVYSIEC